MRNKDIFPDTQQAETLRQLVASGLCLARMRRHRLALLLAGSAPWCRLTAEVCLASNPGQGVWLTDGPGPDDRRPLAAGPLLLGQELDYLVYDAHAGFDPDSFGAATGALRGGGLLMLLTPPLPLWPHLPDPQAHRVTVAPYRPDQLSHRFLTRLAWVLGTAARLIRVEEGAPIPELLPEPWQFGPELATASDPAPGQDSTRENASASVLGSPPRANVQPPPPNPPLPGGREQEDRRLMLPMPAQVAGGSEHLPPGMHADPASDPGRSAQDLDRLCRTEDQRQAVAAILRAARGRARRPLVIVADRGRGKTAALGIAAGELLGSGMRRILVTAPRLSAVDPLFHHATRRRPEAQAAGELRFQAPDALCQAPEPADLLLVDEAAAIPAPLLECLLQAYPRLVFATTIHGYEGTGRGFEVRFRHALERLTPDYRRIALQTPIRWAAADPLEALVARALLLDANPAADAGVLAAMPDKVEPLRFDRDALVRDEATLSQLFGLLVLAHYQTRPLDLRHLLDGPNLQVHALRQGGHIVATALVASEGGLDQDLAEEIYQGRRRPQGHLLPQTLSAHAGLAVAPTLRWARIVRLAVHPAVQGRGLGRRLLQWIGDQNRGQDQNQDQDQDQDEDQKEDRPKGLELTRDQDQNLLLDLDLDLTQDQDLPLDLEGAQSQSQSQPQPQPQPQSRGQGLDLLGVSFGVTTDLLRFWAACGLHPVHLGTSRNAASGAHAAVVLRPLSPAGEDLARRASTRFGRRFPVLLAGPFRHLEPGLVADLLALTCPTSEPPRTQAEDNDPDWRELAAFAFAQRPFEASLAALQALARDRLGPALRAGHCSREEAIPLIVTVLQYRDWAEASLLAGATGRAQLIALLRVTCARLLSWSPS